MKVYTNIDDFKGVKNPIVTTGTFDGVHLGHQKLISRLKDVAREEKGETVLLTFSPHPRMVLFPDDNELKLLNSLPEKIELLEKYGVDHLIIYPFTKEFSRLTSIEFVRNILVNSIQTKRLVIGYNHHFGRNREGSFEHLKEYGPLYGFEVEEIPAKDIDHIQISSTKIRNALLIGDVKTANTYLGHEYTLTGTVEKGKQLGRTIGYPTANLLINDQYKLIPGNGVYAVKIKHKNNYYGGMMNIGNNPTVEGKGKSIEVNIFDFDKDIYGDEVTIYFIDRLRDEVKFNNLEELKEQLAKDKESSLLLYNSTRLHKA
ncbi:MAG TPA: bifunctional riboflavin kinase/FAD synthetase [Bacteroidia bacterium]|jgi:riboflavin kinase/FMN adenylyltransferase|nr:bifunctional riboflavin kinase/FAD synthetase [Bacteroidia bacterium]